MRTILLLLLSYTYILAQEAKKNQKHKFLSDEIIVEELTMELLVTPQEVARLRYPPKIAKSIAEYNKESKLSSVMSYTGKSVYAKECRMCHGFSKTFIGKFSAKEWKKTLEDNGVKLKSFHSVKRVSRITDKFFNSSKYLLELDTLKSFTLEYATKK